MKTTTSTLTDLVIAHAALAADLVVFAGRARAFADRASDIADTEPEAFLDLAAFADDLAALADRAKVNAEKL